MSESVEYETGDIVSWMSLDKHNDCDRRRYGRVREIIEIMDREVPKLCVISGEIYNVDADRDDLRKEQPSYVEVR